MKKIIIYNKMKILFRTNDIELYNNLKSEFKYYLTFEKENKKENIVKLNVLKDSKMYIQYFTKMKGNRERKKCYCSIKRDNILIIDKDHMEISIIYDEYDDNKLQHVGEIIFGIFGKKLEDNGYFFLHAGCVTKENNGILILENDHRKRILLLLNLLEENFEYICDSHLGIKIENSHLKLVGIPTRLEMDMEELYSGILNDKYIAQIKQTQTFKHKFDNVNEAILQTKYANRKFDIKANEIKDVLKKETVSVTNIKTIIELNKGIPVANNKKIKKMNREEIIEACVRNKRDGIYDSVKYIENLYNNIKKRNSGLINVSNIKDISGYRFYINSLNEIKFITKNIVKKKHNH